MRKSINFLFNVLLLSVKSTSNEIEFAAVNTTCNLPSNTCFQLCLNNFKFLKTNDTSLNFFSNNKACHCPEFTKTSSNDSYAAGI